MRKLIKGIRTCIIKGFLNFLKVSSTIFSKHHKTNMSNIMLSICQAAETDKEYVAFQIKPKNTAEIPILEGLNQSNSFAIVLQGPICKKDDMTQNTILFYRKSYPQAKLIVSTWEDESHETLKYLSDLGAVVVLSEKPGNSGFMNVNLQLASSLAGVKKARDLGCDFAVKTRSDQRVCKPYIFDAMISAVKLYPGQGNQKGRIALLTRPDAGMFVPFHPCDFLYLGYTEDLEKLFSAPFDRRHDDARVKNNIAFLTRREISEQSLTAEIYILKHYCQDVLNCLCEDSVKAYWDVVKNNLICYSMKDVDLMWNKYAKLYNMNFYSSSYWGDLDSPGDLCTMCFDYFNWFNLYTGNIKYDRKYEKYLDSYAGINAKAELKK